MRRLRLMAGYAWVLFAGLLALIGVLSLLSSIFVREPLERNQGGLVAVAAIFTLVGVAALAAALKRVRGGALAIGLPGALSLTLGSCLMLFVYVVASIASGPL
jgi:hypothetical protein